MHQTFAASAMSLPIMEEDLLGHVADRRRRQVANTAEEIVEPRPVHPDSRRLYKACDGMFAWTRYVPIFGPAIECYGPKFVFTLDFTEFMSKGMSYYLMQNSFLPMFTRRFGCSAMDYQRLLNVCMMGWSIKPFSATMSDTFAIFGYTKRWFLVGSAALAAICNIIFGTLPAKRSSAATAAVLAFLAGYGQANLDILSEGLYSRLMRRFPGAGPALVSSLWWCLSLAGIIAAVIVGPLSEGGMEADGAFIAGGCMIVVVPIFAVNLFGEETNQVERRADRRAIRQKAKAEREELDAEDLIDSVLPTKTLEFPASVEAVDAEHADVVGFSNDVMEPYCTAAQDDESDDDADMDIPIYCGGAIEFNREVLMRNKPLAIYAAAMTLGVIATVIVTINGSTYPLMGVCVVVSAILCAMGFWALPPVAAKANVFTFLNQALYVNIQGPLQTFYTAEEHQYPPGPHFSLFFYITTTAIIGYVAMIIGATLFPYIFAKRSYRLAFIITIFAEIVGSVFDLILVKRWNVDVGIPDHWVYIWGDAVVYQIAYMLAWMPMVVLLSQLCPRGSESIVYALLAGFANFGQRMAAQIGTLLMDLVWPVDTSNVPYDFSNLPNLVIVGHLCIPLLLLPLIFVLIPGARICDELDVDGKVIGEKGNTEREQKPVKTQEDSEEGSSPLQDDATVNIH